MSEAAFISVGSNIEPFSNIPAAIAALAVMAKPVEVSRVYRSPAVGPTQQADFYNLGARIWTGLDPQELRSVLRQIEATLGRIRTIDKYAPRMIDLDLTLLGSRIIESEGFTIPDPELLRFGHIAIPLAEIDPSFRHPITGESLGEIAERLRPNAHLILAEGFTKTLEKARLDEG